MKKSIYLYPSLEYNDEEFKSDIENKQSSLCVLYNKCFADLSEKKIWLSGEASIGKSSLLETLRIHFLKEDISYIYIDLNELNNNKKALYRLEEKIQKLGTQVTLVLDSYEELYDKNIISRIDEIIYNNCFNLDNIIVSSRDDKRITIDKKRVSIFEKYSRIKINKFTIEQVKGILKRNGMDSSLFSKSTLELLQNTMFLSTMLKINAQKGLRSAYVLAKANTEMTFLQKYFDLVFEEKNNDKEAKTHISTMGKRLYEYIVFNKYSESKVHIPIELQGIFLSRKSKKGYYIKASQLKHTYFAIATYLYETMLEPVFLPERANMLSKDNIASYLDAEFGTYIHSLTYMGEMLRTHRYATEIMALFDKQIPKKKTFLYLNVVAIFLGYNNGVLNDKEQNGVFNLGKAFIKIADKEDFFSFNPYIKLLNSKYLVSFRRCKNGVYGSTFDFKMPSSIKRIKKYSFLSISYAIKSIDVANVTRIDTLALGYELDKIEKVYVNATNKKFKVHNDCLIDNKDRLWLCVSNPIVVPEGIKIIKANAFKQNNSSIYIPKSVQCIERQYNHNYLKIINNKRYLLYDYDEENSNNYNYEIGNLLNLYPDEKQLRTNIETVLKNKGYFDKKEYIQQEIIERDIESYKDENGDTDTTSFKFWTKTIKDGISLNRQVKKELNNFEKNMFKEQNLDDCGGFYSEKTRGYIEDIIVYNKYKPSAIISVISSKSSIKKILKKKNKYHNLKGVIHIITNGYQTKIGRLSDSYKKYRSAHMIQKSIVPNENNILLSPLGNFLSTTFDASYSNEKIVQTINEVDGTIVGKETEQTKEQQRAINLIKATSQKNIKRIRKICLNERYSCEKALELFGISLVAVVFIKYIEELIQVYREFLSTINIIESLFSAVKACVLFFIMSIVAFFFPAIIFFVFSLIISFSANILIKMSASRTKKVMLVQQFLYDNGIECTVAIDKITINSL